MLIPQMSPMNWFFLYFWFSINLIFVMTKLHFFK